MMTRLNNIYIHSENLTQADRQRLLGQKAVTLWLTGLSASGKSTLAYALEHTLLTEGYKCVVLDGDCLRFGLNKDLGFSAEDRAENIRRVSELAKLLNNAGLIVISAFISPYRADRELAREVIGDESFKEVFVNTSLANCEARDPKGLYVKARSGQIAEFTGISSPYEAPVNPVLTLDTALLSIEESLLKLLSLIEPFNP